MSEVCTLEYLNELSPAARAVSDLKNPHIQILLADTPNVFIAEIAMKYGIILVRGRQYVMDSKCPVAESNMLCCRSFASTPTASDIVVGMHLRFLVRS